MGESSAPANPAYFRTKLRRASSVVWVVVELLAEPQQLITIALIICVVQGVTWMTAIFSLLALASTTAFSSIVSIFQVVKNMRRLEKVRSDFPGLPFKQISLGDYVGYLKQTYPYYAAWTESDILPHSYRLMKKRICLLVPDDETALLLPGTFTTYNVIARAWIVMPTKFHEMTKLQHFILLHELGHACIQASLLLFGYRELLLNFSLCALFLAFAKISVSSRIGVTLVALLAGALSCHFFAGKHYGLRSEENDEISADEFALLRCDPTWFLDFDAEELAEALCCETAEVLQNSKNGTLRKKMLAYNISQVRLGGKLCSQREATSASVYDRVVVPLFLAIYYICGTHIQKLTTQTLKHLAILTGLSLVLMSVVSGMGHLYASLLGLHWGLNEPDDQFERWFMRGAAIRQSSASIWEKIKRK